MHHTINCETNSSDSFYEPSLLPEYRVNTSSTRSALDQRGVHQGSDRFDTIVNLPIQVLWYCQTDNIINAKLGDADMYTYRYEPMDKLLALWEK